MHIEEQGKEGTSWDVTIYGCAEIGTEKVNCINWQTILSLHILYPSPIQPPNQSTHFGNQR